MKIGKRGISKKFSGDRMSNFLKLIYTGGWEESIATLKV
jgi:hypothetical protein